MNSIMSSDGANEIREPPKETVSKPSPREKISLFISKHDLKMCGICYVVGVVWFLLLVHPSLNARTYFSENALLPGKIET
jgi:glycosylphosphatidylinositol transamidase